MAIKSILCAYSGEQAEGSGLRHAIQLALYHDAYLTGILRHGRSKMDRRIATIVSKDVHRALHDAEEARAAEVMQRFTDQTACNGLGDRSNYIDLMPTLGMSLSQIARTYDLIVTGQHSNHEDDEFMAADPERIALESGRPVLVVPDKYEVDTLASHVLIAWDGKRAAARAIGEAMSMLLEGTHITVVTVGKPQTIDQHPDGGLVTFLRRHGFEATLLFQETNGRPVASVIDAVAKKIGAQLLVMGAFEHSKFSHNLIGGVTTEIIKSARIPVLMAN